MRSATMWIRCLALLFLAPLLAAPAAADDRLGLPALRSPAAAEVALGRKLFFDRRLSVNATLSCAMCHVPAQGFTANELRSSVGMEGVSLRRNAPTLLNVAHVRALFVDGRAASLEEQALQPLVHPDEMANPDIASVLHRIGRMGDYRTLLRRAYRSERPTAERIAKALSAYQRSLIAANSPFDRWRYGGEASALELTAQRGFAVFESMKCAQCHTVEARHALFSDGQFYNIGTEARSKALLRRPVSVELIPGQRTQLSPEELRSFGVIDPPDLGRHEVTGQVRDLRAFRTPSLRNVALTAPYMHDGSMASLEEVLDYYAAGGTPTDPAQDPRIQPLTLSASERSELLAFLRALSSPAAVRLGQSSP